ncbi:MAG: hypothetical protein M1838_005933 [Thelocarpon superellum]|nr:MAG: hypothetical protein M1838_005933 [Thelocarpon superellum]
MADQSLKRRSSPPPPASSAEPRRASARLSALETLQNDFSLEPFGVANGIGSHSTLPTPSRPAQPSIPQLGPSSLMAPVRSSQVDTAVSTVFPPSADVSPIEPRQRNDSIVSTSRISHPTVMSNKTVSVSSTSTIAPTHGPYQGPSGPSHPYGMYPQDIGLARTASVVTNTSVRPPSPVYAGPRGPQHPYGMYPQNPLPVIVAAEPSNAIPATTTPANAAPAAVLDIPVGFPGLHRTFERRRGPEGEEDGIVGPDGHTEQLPPYSKYPDNAGRKGYDPDLPEESTVAGAGAGAGIGTSHFAPTAEDTLAPLQSRQSMRSMMSDSSRAHLTGPSPDAAERPLPSKEKWAERGKKRVCCGKVPIWAIVLVAVMFAGIILGLIIGRVLNHSHEAALKAEAASPQAVSSAAPAATVFATVTSTFDASPLATPPPDLPQLPTGNYSLDLSTVANSSATCQTDPNQVGAWACEMPLGMSIMEIQISPGSSNISHLVQLLGSPTPPGPPRYGMQPPTVSVPQPLGEMTDLDDKARGPSFVFQVPYTKMVILKNESFGTGPAANKRAFEEALELEERGYYPLPPPGAGPPMSNSPLLSAIRHDVAQPGDQPWYCYWNDTILQGFIYVTQDSSTVNRRAAATTTAASGAAPSTTPATPNSSPSQSSLAPYPKVVKIEDRRAQDPAFTVQPYCTQMQVLEDGTVGPAPPGPNGSPTTITIAELSPTASRSRKRSVVEKRQSRPGLCRCQWITG